MKLAPDFDIYRFHPLNRVLIALRVSNLTEICIFVTELIKWMCNLKCFIHYGKGGF